MTSYGSWSPPGAFPRRLRSALALGGLGVLAGTVAAAVTHPRGTGAAFRLVRRSVARVVADARSPLLAAPRPVPFVVVKRTNARPFDTYGHWWVEIDGVESYGWWPQRCPVRLRDVLAGGPGQLNGIGGSCRGGSPTRDPRHGRRADHCLHPVVQVRKGDRRIRRELRAFAHGYAGEWRWSIRPASNCRSFQLDLLAAAALSEAPEDLHTRGRGCPLLRPARRARGRFGRRPVSPEALVPRALRSI